MRRDPMTNAVAETRAPRIGLPTWSWAVLICGVVFATSLPTIEGWAVSTRTNNTIRDARRYPDRICWIWSSVKAREGWTDDADVKLDVLNRDGQVINTFKPEFYREDTGAPWQSGLVIGFGPVSLPYCAKFPRAVLAMDRPILKVRFTPIFHGVWYGHIMPWSYPIRTPDVVPDAVP